MVFENIDSWIVYCNPVTHSASAEAVYVHVIDRNLLIPGTLSGVSLVRWIFIFSSFSVFGIRGFLVYCVTDNRCLSGSPLFLCSFCAISSLLCS